MCRSNKQDASRSLAKRLTRSSKLQELEEHRATTMARDAANVAAEAEDVKSYTGKWVSMTDIVAELPRSHDLAGT